MQFEYNFQQKNIFGFARKQFQISFLPPIDAKCFFTEDFEKPIININLGFEAHFIYIWIISSEIKFKILILS